MDVVEASRNSSEIVFLPKVTSISNWNDFEDMGVRSPLEYLKNASVNNVIGTYEEYSEVISASANWQQYAVDIGSSPICEALCSDDSQKVADAEQWNFNHLTWYNSRNIAPILKNLIFIRGGIEWRMIIPFKSNAPVKDVFLTYKNNLLTKGDAQGKIPVISFKDIYTPDFNLQVTLSAIGVFEMALILVKEEDSSLCAYQSDWIVVD